MFTKFNWGTIFVYLIIFLLIIIFSIWLVLELKYNEFSKWFKDGEKLDEAKRSYKKILNFKSTIYGYTSKIIYNISTINSPPQSDVNLTQAHFIWSQLMPYQFSINKSTGFPTGILTPRALCVSIKPYPKTGDTIFDTWYANDAPGKTKNINVPLTYDSSKNPVCTPFSETDKSRGCFYGVYPATSDFISWQILIGKWLGTGWKLSDVVDAQSGLKVYLYNDGKGDQTNALDHWYNSYTYEDGSRGPQPDNF
jgi:hypothetical protein